MRKVWALAAPMILSNISVPLVALVDSTVIGHLPHAHQLGAVAVGAFLVYRARKGKGKGKGKGKASQAQVA
jgi:Na+-driven multidrug efflux pump